MCARREEYSDVNVRSDQRYRYSNPSLLSLFISSYLFLLIDVASITGRII